MRKNSIIASVLFFCLLLSGRNVIAQDNKPAPDEQDKKYTPNPSSIFNNAGKKSEPGSHADITAKSFIKFCPTMVLRQKVAFFYERDFSNGFTTQLGVGKAFGDDYFQRGFLDIKSFVNVTDMLSVSDLMDNATYESSFPLLCLSGRYYASGTPFQGGFIELGYRYEKIDYLLKSTINNHRIDGSNRASFTMNNFLFGYGYTGVVGEKRNIIHEFFVNFGVKYFRYTQFDEVRLQYPNSTESQLVYQKTSQHQKMRILPSFNIGYSFGFGF